MIEERLKRKRNRRENISDEIHDSSHYKQTGFVLLPPLNNTVRKKKDITGRQNTLINI